MKPNDEAGKHEAVERKAPGLVDLEGGQAPGAPAGLQETGVEPEHLKALALKLAHTTFNFTTEWASDRLRLPPHIVEDLLQELAKEAFLDILGPTGPFTYRYAITRRGAEEAARIRAISGYVGPAPVSLEAYATVMEWQFARFPEVKPREVAEAVSEMVLPENVVNVAGVALASGRSLFLSGPPGNGKTSLGRLLHGALKGDLWIPYSIGVEDNVIRVFDPLCHLPASAPRGSFDRRWTKIRRPLITVGGELTIRALDLAYSPSLRFYEAPIHVKSNGGLLLIDDFGRQRVDPRDLLNRWIVPLEYGVDHLNLETGQQVKVPFRQFLVVATNLELAKVTDSAFLRRMGYRVTLENPGAKEFAEIFARHAARRGISVPAALVDGILERYRAEGRELRACHPRDLIDRALDDCRFHEETPRLTAETLDRAWAGYFGAR